MCQSKDSCMPQAVLDSDDQGCAEMLVVFVGHTQCRFLAWLKQGFKHCFVAQREGDCWIICDPLKNHMELSLLNLPPNFCLSRFYLDEGYVVVAGYGPRMRRERRACLEILTCVTVAKKLIGIRSFWTFTPWQLFRVLCSMGDAWQILE